ncbi:BON domain-containing protein [Gallaecimonas pentaromativorans]|uniref:BON domain-containing protein n=1 Tax=Gallaecimonas pentaromativorans TaxID=584787 RepID=A0A3N1PBB3_9GAMM|nr:BON domain-containing protein [Gallaecimonas pentaromativorans]MED5526263.1 BON domain-containing protein [Pseudomonadota bacterium]ROQ24347.1 BON domain-containing protein [Gallaecimonas pentaromativorans]
MRFNKTVLTALTLTALASAPAMAANNWKGDAKDAWLDGKLETALMLNTELNNFTIDTEVSHGVATLSGTVSSDVEKDLAGQIAKNVDGVSDVNNKLTVKKDYKGEPDKTSKNFSRAWHDATITAGLNMKYAASSELSAMDIDVDTDNGVVTLTGEVKNDAAHDLAIEMAKGYDNVSDVKDNLKVSE